MESFPYEGRHVNKRKKYFLLILLLLLIFYLLLMCFLLLLICFHLPLCSLLLCFLLLCFLLLRFMLPFSTTISSRCKLFSSAIYRLPIRIVRLLFPMCCQESDFYRPSPHSLDAAPKPTDPFSRDKSFKNPSLGKDY